MKRGNAVRDSCPLVGSLPCQKAARDTYEKETLFVLSAFLGTVLAFLGTILAFLGTSDLFLGTGDAFLGAV
jgi:hypothetical protein